MQQYFDIKAQHSDSLLLFQVGDFYELFFDDAKTAASLLAITLTKRGKNKGEDIPLCGIPVHALNHYLTKLIKAGYRVALCEQLTKPQPGTVVERGVTRVFTPATLTETAMLDEKAASYLLSFFPGDNEWGLLFGELLTAQLFATTIPIGSTRMIESELIRFIPDEIIISKANNPSHFASYFKKLGYYATPVDYAMNDDIAGPDLAQTWMTQQFCSKTQALLQNRSVISDSLTLFFRYLKKNQEKALDQFKSVHFYEPDDFVILDPSTQKNLELIKNNTDGGRKNTLLEVLDKAKTAMGSRTIKKWIQRPLVQKSSIIQRHEVVNLLKTDIALNQRLDALLSNLADIERIIGRIALKRAQLNDYCALKQSLQYIPEIKGIIQQAGHIRLLQTIHDRIANFETLYQLLECGISDDPSSDHMVKTGYDHELDRLRKLLNNSHDEILRLEQAEITRTGIPSLKIGFNNISGYYIEITNTHREKIPDYFQHQQTLANRQRFTTQSLKELERDLSKAQNELNDIEKRVFERIKNEVEQFLTPLRHCAQSIAMLDALFGFARAAYEFRYCRPTFNDHRSIHVAQGRHPMVEQASNATFTPNDITLTDEQSTWLITGPNMGGKSTYLRQTALMCLMAQCGSFVPADAADLFVIDRVFTRIGSGDNLAEGKSTFLVEMEETATICTQATKNSLVILDEVGRGTSTYDGMALAQAIIEHIHLTIKARCLFATHYHELTHLAQRHIGIVNYHTSCKRMNDAVIFLHKIKPGVAEGSFGLAVAHLAQLPQAIIRRAKVILDSMDQRPILQQQLLFTPAVHVQRDASKNKILESQLASCNSILNELKALDCSNLTPKQAFDILWKISEKIKEM